MCVESTSVCSLKCMRSYKQVAASIHYSECIPRKVQTALDTVLTVIGGGTENAVGNVTSEGGADVALLSVEQLLPGPGRINVQAFT